MIKLIVEDIDGIRYCVISRTNNRKFYDFEEFCDSSLEARKLAKEYADSDFHVRIHNTEYWAFDTKKWKASLPINFMKGDQTFDPNLPIYCATANGEAELLTNYINREVNKNTGRWEESYNNLKENLDNENWNEAPYETIYIGKERYHLPTFKKTFKNNARIDVIPEEDNDEIVWSVYYTPDFGKAGFRFIESGFDSKDDAMDYVDRKLLSKLGLSENVLYEQDVEIEVKHEGILEVPEGKNVEDLPISHFVDLAKKKGLSKITKALNNLQVWNKKKNPELSKWAGNMIDEVSKRMENQEKKESIVRVNEGSRPFDWITDAADYYYRNWVNGFVSNEEIRMDLKKKGYSDDFIDSVFETISDRYEDEERYDYEHDYYDESLKIKRMSEDWETKVGYRAAKKPTTNFDNSKPYNLDIKSECEDNVKNYLVKNHIYYTIKDKNRSEDKVRFTIYAKNDNSFNRYIKRDLKDFIYEGKQRRSRSL